MKTSKVRLWSSVEYPSIMEPIAHDLRSLGYDAEHRFFISNSSYRSSASSISRIILRIKMYLLYPIYFVFKELCSPSKVCIVCTNTFYVTLLSTLIPRRNRRSINLIYDLFPDTLITSGSIKSTSPIASVIKAITRASLKRSSSSVVLGENLKRHIIDTYKTAGTVSVIPVGTDCAPFRDSQPLSPSKPGKTSILYCGNFGHLHDFRTLASFFASQHPVGDSFQFTFSGHGHGMKKFRSSLPDALSNGPLFTPGLSNHDWEAKMKESEIGLVTMANGAEKILMPSKTYSAMAAGQAILAICPEDSDLAELIRKHECGWYVTPEDHQGFVETLEEIHNTPEELQKRRLNAKRAAENLYDSLPIAKRWATLIDKYL